MPSTLTQTHLSLSLQAGRYFDTTPHLHLLVKANGAKYWVYRFVDLGKRRDLGLGRYPQTSVAEARTKANDFNLKLSRGEPLGTVEPSPPQAIIFRDFASGGLSRKSP